MKPVAARVVDTFSIDLVTWYRKQARNRNKLLIGARLARIVISRTRPAVVRAEFLSFKGDLLAWGDYVANPHVLAGHFKRARSLQGVEVEVR